MSVYRSNSPHGQYNKIQPMGLSTLVNNKYGFAPSAHRGKTLSRMVGGPGVRGSGTLGSVSSDTSPGGVFEEVGGREWEVEGEVVLRSGMVDSGRRAMARRLEMVMAGRDAWEEVETENRE